MASKKHKVMISGEGADEMFAGYNNFLENKLNIFEGSYGVYEDQKILHL